MLLPEETYGHGELLIRIGEASREIEKATTNRGQLYLQRGELYREDLNWQAAFADYDRAAQLEPNCPAIDCARAKAFADSGQLEAARQTLDLLLGRSENFGDALFTRARVLRKLHLPELAIIDFRKALKVIANPEPACFLELSETLVETNQKDKAVECLDAGMKHFGPLVNLQTLALDLDVSAKNFDRALERLDTIAQQAPRKEKIFARRGEILIAAGRPAAARQAYESALRCINLLPIRLQEGPAMQQLQIKINQALATISQTLPQVTSR